MGQTAELTQVATRIDEELLRRLDERCEAEDRPRAYVLEKALEKHLIEVRTGPKAGATA